jgi:hypothetical protein
VTWAVPEALLPHVIVAAPELMLAAAAEGGDGEWNADSADALLQLAQERDVLTGIIAGLLAQGLNASQAAAFGVYLHGLAGETAARRRGHAVSVIAGDIIEAL